MIVLHRIQISRPVKTQRAAAYATTRRNISTGSGMLRCVFGSPPHRQRAADEQYQGCTWFGNGAA